jgi:sec-independent protein translocase protein TatA
VQLGPAEILVILVVTLLVFGPNRLPELARQAAKGLREFRAFQQNLRSELEGVLNETPRDGTGQPPTLAPRPAGDVMTTGATSPESGTFPIADAPAAGAPSAHESQQGLTPPGSPPD